MPIPRPKILTRVTVPTGGWELFFKLSDVGSGSLGNELSAVIAAGDYYVAWDGQDSDFLWELCTKMNAAIHADAVYSGGSKINHFVWAWIDTNHKVNIQFIGSDFQGANNDDFQITWTHVDGDGASIAGVLGFDGSADDQSIGSNNATFTGDYQHGYAWYATEDGWLRDLPTEDVSITEVVQAKSLSGRVTTQHIADRYESRLALQFVTRAKMFSRDKGYTQAPVDPYLRNVGLECWWASANQGVEFRVYRDGSISNTDKLTDAGTQTSGTGTTLTDSGKAWTTEPTEHTGRLVQTVESTADPDISIRGYISTNSATALTLPDIDTDIATGLAWGDTTQLYRIYDQRYQTYVVNLESMEKFDPRELPALDRYDIDIPLLRFVS